MSDVTTIALRPGLFLLDAAGIDDHSTPRRSAFMIKKYMSYKQN